MCIRTTCIGFEGIVRKEITELFILTFGRPGPQNEAKVGNSPFQKLMFPIKCLSNSGNMSSNFSLILSKRNDAAAFSALQEAGVAVDLFQGITLQPIVPKLNSLQG